MFQKIKKVVKTKSTSLTKPMGYHGVVCDTNVMKYFNRLIKNLNTTNLIVNQFCIFLPSICLFKL